MLNCPKAAIILISFIGLTLGCIGSSTAYVDGPPLSTAGGFGTNTCQECHFENALNDDVGSLQLGGIPNLYVPGQQYAITVALNRPDIGRGGFQLAVRFSDGYNKGFQAGLLESFNDRTEIVTDADSLIQYAQQTDQGSLVEATGFSRWKIRWTAPKEKSQSVTFNVAANASNNDQSELGDFIYTNETIVFPQLINSQTN